MFLKSKIFKMARDNSNSATGKGSEKDLEMTLMMIEELTEFFDSQNSQMDSALFPSGYMGLDTGYKSMIRMDGAPILPPVMTHERREEMQQYKRQAVIAETRLKNRRREKLLAKVQSIVDEIETRRTPSPQQECLPTNQGDITATMTTTTAIMTTSPTTQQRSSTYDNQPDVTDSTGSDRPVTVSGSCASSGSSVSELNRTVIETSTLLKEKSKINSASDTVENTTLNNSNSEKIQTLDGAGGALEMTGAVGSDNVKDQSSSSGHDSGFVTGSVVPCSDYTDSQFPNSELPNSDLPNSDLSDLLSRVVLSPTDGETADKVPNVMKPGDQKTPEKVNEVGQRPDDGKGGNDQWHSNSSPRTESVCDSEAVSYMGEYCALPTPAPTGTATTLPNSGDQQLLTPDVSVIPYETNSVVISSSVPSSSQNQPLLSITQASMGSTASKPEQLLSQKSLNPDSVVTATNTASTDLRQYMQGSLDTMASSLTLKEEAVGSTAGLKNLSQEKISPGSNLETKSTPGQGHVRKSSYTLEHPSPALLMAHGQMKTNTGVAGTDSSFEPSGRDKPSTAQRKLNYEEEELVTPRDSLDRHSSSRKDIQDSEAEGKREHLQRYLAQISAQPTVSLPVDQSVVASVSQPPKDSPGFLFSTSSMSGLSGGSEEVLKNQARQFEQLRQQLVGQQKSQLAALLLQQQREQMLLQQELVEQEQRFQVAKQQLLQQQGRQMERANAEQWLKQVNQQQSPHVQQMSNPSTPQGCHITDHHLTRSGGHDSDDIALDQVHIVNRPGHQLPSGQLPSGQFYSSQSLPSGQLRQSGPSSKEASPNWQSQKVVSPRQRLGEKRHNVAITPAMERKFCMLSAAVKGYLTRRLYRTEKVQAIIQTIKDTTDLAISIQTESPTKKMAYLNQDKNLQDRVIAQLRAGLLEIHDIFFELPVWERMQIIAQDRQLEQERLAKQNKNDQKKKRLSAATQKALERKKKAQLAESAVFGHSIRPKTSPETSSPKVARTDLSGPLRRQYQSLFSKALKPTHGNLSPIKPVSDKENRLKVAPKEGTGKINAFSVTGGGGAQKSARRNLQSALGSPKRKTAVKSTTKPKLNNVSRAAWR